MPKSLPSPLRSPRVRIASTLSALLALSLTGCLAPAGDETHPGGAADDRPLVITTFTVLADLVQTVAGEELRVQSLTKTGAEIHGYEPTPSDLVRAQEAALILDNGLGLEGWFERFLADLDAPHVTLSDGVEPIMIGEGEYTGRPNPHAWMSPVTAERYVDNAVEALSALRPESAEVFAANGASYKEQLRALAGRLEEALSVVPQEQRILVSCEGAFSYLARDLGLEEAYLWAVNQERQGTPQQIAAVIDLVREREVPAVFCESTVSDQPQRLVAEESGARFGGILYVDSLSDGAPVPTLLALLEYDIDTIITGLTGAPR